MVWRAWLDVGAGLSWMFWRNWDLWVEYDYMGFGTKSVTLNGEGIFSTFTFGVDVKQSVSIASPGLAAGNKFAKNWYVREIMIVNPLWASTIASTWTWLQ